MRAKLITVTLVIAAGLVAWGLYAPRGASTKTAQETAAPRTHNVPAIPEDLTGARKRIQQSSELLQTQLIPLLKKMPEDIERVQALLKLNDDLIRKLSEMPSFN